MTVTSVRLSTGDLEKLDLLAAEKKVKRAVIIRWALDEYLTAHPSFFLKDCPTDSQKDYGVEKKVVPA